MESWQKSCCGPIKTCKTAKKGKIHPNLHRKEGNGWQQSRRAAWARSLGSLFEESGAGNSVAEPVSLPLRDIEPDKSQPRKAFDEESLAALAGSIAKHGLLQPIAVRPAPAGGWRIIAGERRWRAARMAGLTEVPVVIREVSDEQAMELALIENLQRE
ncbi:MAG: ParB/RepB/Spo0J family partition protein [Oscillospiraceae bacterium]